MSTTLSRKEQSHERIVGVAARAIRRAGMRGVGVADIMKEAGLTHGGFYAHFASRDAMVVEAMQRAGEENLAALSQAAAHRLRKHGSPWVALVRSYLHEVHIDRSEDGCVVAALASEMNRFDDAVRDEARQRVRALVDLVRSALPEGVAPDQAEVATATMVGALQMARTLGGQPGRELLAQTRQALIERYEPKTRS